MFENIQQTDPLDKLLEELESEPVKKAIKSGHFFVLFRALLVCPGWYRQPVLRQLLGLRLCNEPGYYANQRAEFPVSFLKDVAVFKKNVFKKNGVFLEYAYDPLESGLIPGRGSRCHKCGGAWLVSDVLTNEITVYARGEWVHRACKGAFIEDLLQKATAGRRWEYQTAPSRCAYPEILLKQPKEGELETEGRTLAVRASNGMFVPALHVRADRSHVWLEWGRAPCFGSAEAVEAAYATHGSGSVERVVAVEYVHALSCIRFILDALESSHEARCQT